MNRALFNATQRAQKRVQTDREDIDAGTATIAGIDYSAAITLTPAARVFSETGQVRYVQNGNVAIKKEALTSCPAIGTTVAINGMTFEIKTNGLPELQPRPAWQLTIQRWIRDV